MTQFYGMAQKKLLVADDSVTIQKVIRLALTSTSEENEVGYDIQVVADGTDAIEQISLFRPDIVLIDVGLPGKNAFEVKKEINEHDDLEEIRFVLMSSAFESVDEATANEVEFHGALTKPFDPANLRQVIRDVLAQVESRKTEKTAMLSREEVLKNQPRKAETVAMFSANPTEDHSDAPSLPPPFPGAGAKNQNQDTSTSSNEWNDQLKQDLPTLDVPTPPPVESLWDGDQVEESVSSIETEDPPPPPAEEPNSESDESAPSAEEQTSPEESASVEISASLEDKKEKTTESEPEAVQAIEFDSSESESLSYDLETNQAPQGTEQQEHNSEETKEDHQLRMMTTPPEEDQPPMEVSSSLESSSQKEGEDIRSLTESTIRISGLDDYEWEQEEPSLRPRSSHTEDESVSFLLEAPQELKPPFYPEHAEASQPRIKENGRNSMYHEHEPHHETEHEEEYESVSIHQPGLRDQETRSELGTREYEEEQQEETPTYSGSERSLDSTNLDYGELEKIIQDQVEVTLIKMSREVIPKLAEKIIKEEIHRILSENK